MTLLTKILYHASRLLLAAVFIYAGMIKANDIAAFAGQVANYKILPYAWNYLVAAILPYLELLCGVLLLLNKRVRPAVLVLFILNIVFILALSSVISRGFDIDCGCFNPNATTSTSPVAALLRDFGLIVLMIVTWCLYSVSQAEGAE
ncbi:Methylamine utilisation protein MauE [Desulfuromusa kysingii]|uniref:Methylamine utilisation protein MauE n=1 Tax=Desulfuromusa kysingii TaxID=37625 RepID=A0A1H3W677_9BACT|nr:MauE/DoxX family redox-associated membrane protein [Desulfuromusa kysingii]SDZ82587.1 Methylamine utilisation protein MauE [Desulfuromusa kysingii]